MASLGFEPSDFWRDPLTQPQALAFGTLVTTEDDTHARQASLQKTCQMLTSRLQNKNNVQDRQFSSI